jgi:hypothetical protein
MSKTQRHHLLQQARQKEIFGVVIDNTTIELPTAYHQQKINPLQQKGVGDAYLAGTIDYDSTTGKIDDYKE